MGKKISIFGKGLPFGVIPKQHASGQWRLDLSHPKGVSVNNLTLIMVQLGREHN